jgi:hypothetical protein
VTLDERLPMNMVEEAPKTGRESAVWFNAALNTFIIEWASSPKFQSWFCRKLYRIYNKKRPPYIGEIMVKRIELTNSPEINDLQPLNTNSSEDFYYEFNLEYNGEIKIQLEFEVQLNWPKIRAASMLVSCKVVVMSFYARVKLCFMPSYKGKSWYSLVSAPAYDVHIEPVLGRFNKIALSKFPQLTTFLSSMIALKIQKFVWPNKRTLRIPYSRAVNV